jgi:hypothetical protein
MSEERVLDVYSANKNIYVVTATDDPSVPRNVVELPFRVFYETATIDPHGDHTYYYGADTRCRVSRTYVDTKKDWRDTGDRIREYERGNLRSFLSLKPEIAWMIQNNVRLGDNYNARTGKFTEGADGLIPLRVLCYDLETSSLDPTLPTAHVITIAAVVIHVFGDRIEYIKKWVGQLGTINLTSDWLNRHRDKHPRCPLIVRTFPCPVSSLAVEGISAALHSRILQAESSLIAAYSAFLIDSDVDLVMVCISAHAWRGGGNRRRARRAGTGG